MQFDLSADLENNTLTTDGLVNEISKLIDNAKLQVNNYTNSTLVCQIRIVCGKGKKDRQVPFPKSFRETLAMHINNSIKSKHTYLFESSWEKQYSDRGIRKMLAKYSQLGLCCTTSVALMFSKFQADRWL